MRRSYDRRSRRSARPTSGSATCPASRNAPSSPFRQLATICASGSRYTVSSHAAPTFVIAPLSHEQTEPPADWLREVAAAPAEPPAQGAYVEH